MDCSVQLKIMHVNQVLFFASVKTQHWCSSITSWSWDFLLLSAHGEFQLENTHPEFSPKDDDFSSSLLFPKPPLHQVLTVLSRQRHVASGYSWVRSTWRWKWNYFITESAHRHKKKQQHKRRQKYYLFFITMASGVCEDVREEPVSVGMNAVTSDLGESICC